MKAAVFSDTHGNTALMAEAVRRTRPDCIIHLGDMERDTAVLRREFPEIPLYQVCGNCDIGASSPLSDVVQLGPVKAFITHGHADMDNGNLILQETSDTTVEVVDDTIIITEKE